MRKEHIQEEKRCGDIVPPIAFGKILQLYKCSFDVGDDVVGDGMGIVCDGAGVADGVIRDGVGDLDGGGVGDGAGNVGDSVVGDGVGDVRDGVVADGVWVIGDGASVGETVSAMLETASSEMPSVTLVTSS